MHYSFFPFAFTTIVAGHGIITSPHSRSAGDAMKAVCGQQVTNNLQSNEYGDIQQLLQIGTSQKDFDPSSCNLSLCKGQQFGDNTANVQNFTTGQVLPITVDIQAKHTGTANVSVVDTASNTMISSQLAYFPVYASTSTDIPKNQTQFNITMPDVGSQCNTAGACVVQWFWDSRESDQTYMSCIDFTM
jgi:Lytic polysaccharide mono-oxygenase, cellulose-degrading